MSMPISEKNFLERVAAHIPGIAGYREREGRRESDKRLREFLSGRLEGGRDHLNAIRRAAIDSGALGLMSAVSEIDKTLQKTVSSLRFADYGYSGLFDQVKIREEELDKIYAYDERLLDAVEDLVKALGDAAKAGPDAASLADLQGRADELDDKVVERKHLFETPAR